VERRPEENHGLFYRALLTVFGRQYSLQRRRPPEGRPFAWVLQKKSAGAGL